MNNRNVKFYVKERFQLKEEFEQDAEDLRQYNDCDDSKHPAWTFLINEVVKTYGICPFLNNQDEDSFQKRVEWLNSQKDKGQLYYEIVEKLTTPTFMEELEKHVVDLKNELTEYVQKMLKNVDSLDDDVQIIIDHDKLVENIRLRKEAKSQTKMVKEIWNQTLRCLDHIVLSIGIDFTKYIQAVHGYVVRYKPPSLPEGKYVDSEFESLFERHSAAVAKMNNTKNMIEKEKEDAWRQLTTLIKNNFQVEQVRKYYKKWSSLTPDKKEDRIKSYCEWYARKNNKTMAFADQMATFIASKMDGKELRMMDIKWDIKLGIITDINIVVTEDDGFELAKRAPRILKSPRRSSKKKKDEMFQNEEGQELQKRINRLTLFEMLKGQTLKKESVVANVIRNLNCRNVHENTIADYVSGKYEDILQILKQDTV